MPLQTLCAFLRIFRAVVRVLLVPLIREQHEARSIAAASGAATITDAVDADVSAIVDDKLAGDATASPAVAGMSVASSLWQFVCCRLYECMIASMRIHRPFMLLSAVIVSIWSCIPLGSLIAV